MSRVAELRQRIEATFGLSLMTVGHDCHANRMRFSPIALSLFFMLCLGTNWPGRLNEDSLQQFVGFLDTAAFSDLHSPVVTWLWNLPHTLVGQPGGALIVQSALFSVYAALIPRSRPRGPAEIVLFGLDSLFKFSLVILAGFIIKDVLLCGVSLAGLAVLTYAPGTRRPALWRGLGMGFLLLSLFVRPTNFIIVIVALAWMLPLLAGSWRARFTALAALTFLFSLTVPLSGFINRQLIGAKPGHAEIQLMMFDSAGMSARTGRDLFADLPGWPAGLADPRRCYTATEAGFMTPWSSCRGFAAAGLALYPTGRRAMISWWLGNIVSHPIAYLEHRLAFTGYLLDPIALLRDHTVYARIANATRPYLYAVNRPGRTPAPFATWQEYTGARIFSRFSGTLLGWRWSAAMALLASVGVIGWSWRQRWRGRNISTIATFAAALAVGNFVMHAIVGIASQDRYLLPTVLCSSFAVFTALRFTLHERRSSVKVGMLG